MSSLEAFLRNGRSTGLSSSELFQVSAAIAAEPPASSAPVRTSGAIHFAFGLRIIVELLDVGCVQTQSCPMNLNEG